MDLNTATAAELASIPGVGPALAQRIIGARPFASVDDLARVPGLGSVTLEAIRKQVAVAEPSEGIDDGLPVGRPDVVQIRFRAEDDGSVTKVIHDAGIEEPFVEPYRGDRSQVLARLQESVVPFRFDPSFQSEVGNGLTRSLFAQDLGSSPIAGEVIRATKAAGGRPTTIQLVFDAAATGPSQLPWELIHDENGPLLADERLRLNRHITYFGDREPFGEVDPLRVLYLESRPKDAESLPDMSRNFRDAVDRLGARVEADFIRHVTLGDLEAALKNGEYHIVHYDGHGVAGALAFEDGSRNTAHVHARQLAELLEGSRVRLVVLGACQGSTVEGIDLFQATAPALIRAGIPAVVANQFSVYVDAQKEFTYAFYASLARGESISAAVADGRTAMATVRGHYFLPTLYLRVADGEGYLFGGEPETHRRWRMSEMQKLAAWWYGLSALQQAWYTEGILRWQRREVAPIDVPNHRATAPAADALRTRHVQAARERPGSRPARPSPDRLGDVSGVYDLVGVWRPPAEQDVFISGQPTMAVVSWPRQVRVCEAAGEVVCEAIREDATTLVFRFRGSKAETTIPMEGVRSFQGGYRSNVGEIANGRDDTGRPTSGRIGELGANRQPAGALFRSAAVPIGAELHGGWDRIQKEAELRFDLWIRRRKPDGSRLSVPEPVDDPPICLDLPVHPFPGTAEVVTWVRTRRG